MRWIDQITQTFFGGEIRRQVRQALAVIETENTFTVGAQNDSVSPRDRLQPERATLLEDALAAWRTNPLARRIVELTSQYVVGGGITFTCTHPATAQFLAEFWNHPLNRMDVRVVEWCDELTRTGNLFLLLTTDPAGMSYLRAVPASEIESITARPNDCEQAVAFTGRRLPTEPNAPLWRAYDAAQDAPAEDGSFIPTMLHYAVNRPVGAQWGESDLAPLLRWLARYSAWLEDRARLNRFRTAFLYVVKSRFQTEAQRLVRQSTLNAHPPTPGSVLVTDENETWEILNPHLAADDAERDGLALKKMIAAGAGVPLHFLAEPESATRTTAEAAGGPTYRRFEQRQNYFRWLLGDVLRAALNRRALVDRHIRRRAEISILGADISARDNVSLGMAAGNIYNALGGLFERGLISDTELLRMVYRFAGEVVNPANLLAQAQPGGSSDAGYARVRINPLEPETSEPPSTI